MSCVVALDTAGTGGAVAIARDGALLGRAEHDPSLGYAEELFGLLDSALEQARLARDAIDTVAVVRGPGSFTGLRIGVMTAKTLARARGWHLRAAPTLSLVAAGCADPGGPVLAVADAGGGKLWLERFESVGTDPSGPAPERVSPGQLAGRWREGEYVAIADPSLQSLVASAVPELASAFLAVAPLADTLALAASSARWPAVEVDPLALFPEYVSASQAERVHGVDLRDEVHRHVQPRNWE